MVRSLKWLFCAFSLLTPIVVQGQVSGVVVDQTTLQPIEGAIVSLQAAGARDTTDSTGSFVLPIPAGDSVVIVGAKKFFYNKGLRIFPPASNIQLPLAQVPQDSNTSYAFVTPTTCGSCHPQQLNQWNNSPMALAGRNRWVYDTYDGTGTPGGMGGFVYTRDSRYAAAHPYSECASCHQPEPWIKSPFSPLDPIDSLSQGAMHGISCEVCHKVAHLDESKPNFPGIYPGSVVFTRPAAGSGQVQYGSLGDVSYSMSGMMRSSFQPQMSALLCAACHQDKNDPDMNGNFEEPNGIISEPTYLEWLASPYADPQSGFYATCVTCHMPSYGATVVCQTPLYTPPVRNPETIRSHRIEGTTPAFLENAVDLLLDVQEAESTTQVTVRIANTMTGHHVPTGVTIRNMILLVEAWNDANGTPLPFLGSQTIHPLGGVGDPSQGYYAGLPGKLYAKVIHDSLGNYPTFFTDAAGIVFDNRIPALETDTTFYEFVRPPGGTEYSIRARLIYRRSFRALVDAKGWTQDGHGNPLADLLPPHFGHLKEEATWNSGPTDVSSSEASPRLFRLHQNYPNPANPGTTIRFEIAQSGKVELNVVDITGRTLKILVNRYLAVGDYSLWLDVSHFASGIYFYVLRSEGRSEARKFLVIK